MSCADKLSRLGIFYGFPCFLLTIILGINLCVYFFAAKPDADRYTTLACYCFSCNKAFILMYDYTITNRDGIVTVNGTSCADYLKHVPCYYSNMDNVTIGIPPEPYNFFFVIFNLVTGIFWVVLLATCCQLSRNSW